jgi:hypothetical protein
MGGIISLISRDHKDGKWSAPDCCRPTIGGWRPDGGARRNLKWIRVKWGEKANTDIICPCGLLT